MKAVIVGAGATTRELMRRLGDSWDVVVIDSIAFRFLSPPLAVPSTDQSEADL